MSSFTDDAVGFLARLANHNDRAWFKAHEAEFEEHVRAPALEFIQDAADWMEMAGHPFRGEAKKSGGALTRIHRDVRFSKDKAPYHTYVGCYFHHKDAAKGVAAPVVGLRFDATGDIGLGGGLYGGDTTTLNKVRDAIVRRPDDYAAATDGLELWGDSLKTAPKGYDKNHPLIEDIRRKAWMASVPITTEQFTGDLLGAFQHGVETVAPLTSFLAEALL